MESPQPTYMEALEDVRIAYEREKIQLTSYISTLEVAVGQQSIKIKKLEDQKIYEKGYANDMADAIEFIQGYLDTGASMDGLIPALQVFITNKNFTVVKEDAACHA